MVVQYFDFTYFEMEDIPNSTIVLDGSQCFSNLDLGVLDDIITIEDITKEDFLNV